MESQHRKGIVLEASKENSVNVEVNTTSDGLY